MDSPVAPRPGAAAAAPHRDRADRRRALPAGRGRHAARARGALRFVAAALSGRRREAARGPAPGLDELYGLPVATVAAGAPAASAARPPRAPGGGAGAPPCAAPSPGLAGSGARVVVDVSDEPVLGYEERFQLISVALSWGARYVGADFEFSPQPLARLSSKPSLAIIGTGKRVGKTAVSGFFGRRLGGRFGLEQVVIVAMGRGGTGGSAGGLRRRTGWAPRGCWRCRGRGCTPPPTTSRTPCSPA